MSASKSCAINCPRVLAIRANFLKMVRIGMKEGRSHSYLEVRQALSMVKFRIAFGDFADTLKKGLLCLNDCFMPSEVILIRTESGQQFKGPTPVIRTHWVLSQE